MTAVNRISHFFGPPYSPTAQMLFPQFLPFILAQLADTVTISGTFLVGSFIPAFKSGIFFFPLLVCFASPNGVVKWFNGFVQVSPIFCLWAVGLAGFLSALYVNKIFVLRIRSISGL